MYVCIFVIGVCSSTYAPNCYIMLLENSPSKYHNIIGSTYQAIDVMNAGVCTLFLVFITKHITHYLYLPLGIAALSVIALTFMPESPRYLYSKGAYDDAREVFAFIARINGREFEPFTFYKEHIGWQIELGAPIAGEAGINSGKHLCRNRWFL